jgi:hypothetical protein
MSEIPPAESNDHPQLLDERPALSEIGRLIVGLIDEIILALKTTWLLFRTWSDPAGPLSGREQSKEATQPSLYLFLAMGVAYFLVSETEGRYFRVPVGLGMGTTLGTESYGLLVLSVCIFLVIRLLIATLAGIVGRRAKVEKRLERVFLYSASFQALFWYVGPALYLSVFQFIDYGPLWLSQHPRTTMAVCGPLAASVVAGLRSRALAVPILRVRGRRRVGVTLSTMIAHLVVGALLAAPEEWAFRRFEEVSRSNFRGDASCFCVDGSKLTLTLATLNKGNDVILLDKLDTRFHFFWSAQALPPGKTESQRRLGETGSVVDWSLGSGRFGVLNAGESAWMTVSLPIGEGDRVYLREHPADVIVLDILEGGAKTLWEHEREEIATQFRTSSCDNCAVVGR